MRKYISIIISFFIIFSIVGCNKQNQPNLKEEQSKFDIKIATNTAKTYLKFISEEKYENANKLLVDKTKSDIKELQGTNLKIIGFRIEAISESAGEGNFKASIVKANKTKPESQVLQYRIKVIKDGIDYKISQVMVLPVKEAFKIFNELRIRKENELDTSLITYMDGIPQYIYLKNDLGKISSVEVPKKEYGLVVLDYTGDIMAISTKNNNDTFLGILSFEETVETQSKETDGGEQQKNEKSTNMVKEKPIGKQLIPCDVFKNTTISNIVFSQDEKLIAVQYKKDKEICIKVYNVQSGELIPLSFEEIYPLNKVNVNFKSFEEDKLIYTVSSKESNSSDNKYIGEWALDTKLFKISKLKK